MMNDFPVYVLEVALTDQSALFSRLYWVDSVPNIYFNVFYVLVQVCIMVVIQFCSVYLTHLLDESFRDDGRPDLKSSSVSKTVSENAEPGCAGQHTLCSLATIHSMGLSPETQAERMLVLRTTAQIDSSCPLLLVNTDSTFHSLKCYCLKELLLSDLSNCHSSL